MQAPRSPRALSESLDAFLGFAIEQSVCHRPVAVDELFPPEARTRLTV